MDFEIEASVRIGDAGEQVVARELHRLAPLCGFKVFDDLLLDGCGRTTRLDHVVVDSVGVLVVESRVLHRADIRGVDDERYWTASYGHGHSKSFSNPLNRSDEHVAALRQALAQCDQRLGAGRIAGVAVFVGADISRLELDPSNRARVWRFERLPKCLDTRRETSAAAELDPEEVAVLTRVVHGLDRSGDDDVVRRYAARRRTAAPEAVRVSAGRPRAYAFDSMAAAMPAAVVAPAGTARIPVPGQRRRRLAALLTELGVGIAAFLVTGGLMWWMFAGGGLQRVAEALPRQVHAAVAAASAATPRTP